MYSITLFCSLLYRLWQANSQMSTRLVAHACLACGELPNESAHREPFSRALGEEDGRILPALVPPTSLPDASNTE